MSITTAVSAVPPRLLRNGQSWANVLPTSTGIGAVLPLLLPVSQRLVHKSVHKTDRADEAIQAHGVRGRGKVHFQLLQQP